MTTEEATPPTESEALSNNRRTVQSYEGYALKYAAAVSTDPSGVGEEGLRRLVATLPAGGTVLEVGSGPGWDADFVESLGVHVHRTDITKAFRDFQTARGKTIEALDLINDDLGGAYDGVMALCVLLNIDRALTEPILQKITGALHQEGLFLVSIREGNGEIWERGEISGEYHVVLWSFDAFTQLLDRVGLRTEWSARHVDSDGEWITLLARKTNEP